MAFTQQELEIIRYGAKNGKSREEVETALTRLRTGLGPVREDVSVPQQPSVFEDLRSDISETGEALKETLETGISKTEEIEVALESGEQGALRSALQKFGVDAKTAARAIGDVILGTGKALVSQEAEEAVGRGVEAVAKPIVESQPVQALIQRYQRLQEENPSLARDIDAALGVTELAGTVVGGVGARVVAKGVVDVVSRAKSLITESAEALRGIRGVNTEGIKQAINLEANAATIMQRVARVTPTQQRNFEDLAGKSVGQYLVDNQIFGDANHVTQELVKKWQTSVKEVNNGLAKFTQTQKSTAFGNALKELAGREQRISSPGAVSSDLERVRELLKKHNAGGLTLSEMNEVKRLYERNVKLDYKRENLPEKVETANTIDNAMRNYIVTRASELGFKNVGELNKQTQLARELADSIGDYHAGRQANNLITLTDWVVLSGGDPTAASAFVAKRLISSQAVQARIAQILGGGKEIPKVKARIEAPSINGYAEFIRAIEGRATLPTSQ